MEIVPFDDASMKRLESQLKKLDGKENIRSFLVKVVDDIYESREKDLGDVMRGIEKFAYLGSIDKHWIEHIDHLDGLREGVRLRAYGQRDPLVEFKNEAFGLFEGLIDRIDGELARRIFRIGVMQQPISEIPVAQATTNVDTLDQTGLMDTPTPELGAEGGSKAFARQQEPASANATARRGKIGRNDPCWCGSGKKWKRCHYPQYG